MSTQTFALLGAVFVMNKINFKRETEDGERNVMILLGCFAVVQVLSILALGFIYNKVKNGPKNDAKVIVKTEVPFSQDPPKVEEMTASAYDERELMTLVKQQGMTLLFTGFIFYKMGVVAPVFIQTVTGPMKLFGENLVKIYLRGETVERPFPKPPGLMDQFKQAQQGGEETTPSAPAEPQQTLEEKKEN
eukprot:Colp12_sorted_trinity150504_noHs@34841